MEYLGGFIISIFAMYAISKLQLNNNILNDQKIMPIKYSQSHVQVLIGPLLPKIEKIKKIQKSQSILHEQKNTIKVIIMDNQAYWIKDHAFYVADMSIDGTVDKDTTRIVDTDGMSKIQLDKMLFIVDKLREGILDDSGSTGNQ